MVCARDSFVLYGRCLAFSARARGFPRINAPPRQAAAQYRRILAPAPAMASIVGAVLAAYAASNLALTFLHLHLARDAGINIAQLLLVQCWFTTCCCAATHAAATSGKQGGVRFGLILRVAPVAALYALGLLSRMLAAKAMPIESIVMGRQLVPLMTCALEYAVARIRGTLAHAPPSRARWISMALVLVGVCIYDLGRCPPNVKQRPLAAPFNNTDWGAAALLTTHLIATAAGNVATHRACACPSTTPLQFTYAVNLASLPFYLLAAYEPWGRGQRSDGSDAAVASVGEVGAGSAAWVPAAAAVALSPVIGWSASACHRRLSAFTFSLFNSALKALTLGLADAWAREEARGGGMGAPQWGGAVIAFAGAVGYASASARRSPKAVKVA